MKTIFWFRRDLRICDSKLLSVDAKNVLPIFIFDTNILSKLPKDDHRVTFIFQKVLALKSELRTLGLDLALFYGEPKSVFEYLKANGFQNVYASVDYDGYGTNRDSEIGEMFEFHPLNDCYLLDFKELLNSGGEAYRVFTPFYKRALLVLNESNYLRYDIASVNLAESDFEHILDIGKERIVKMPIAIESIGFEGSLLGLAISKESPKKLIEEFKSKVSNYKNNRDTLDTDGTSRLGVHLRFGTISVRDVAREILEWQKEGVEVDSFFRQLIWREFFAYIFYHFPKSETQNFLPLNIAWESDETKLEAWRSAKTGVPIVDAAMSELNSTGYMHNRSRMIAASFLTKDLHIDWRLGEAYFAKKLFDYDAASNVGSWQWAASTGTDAQPYFRVFNPYLQSKKFDTEGRYIKKHLPHLHAIPPSVLHDEDKLFAVSINGYPKPIVKHKIEAQKSMEAFRRCT